MFRRILLLIFRLFIWILSLKYFSKFSISSRSILDFVDYLNMFHTVPSLSKLALTTFNHASVKRSVIVLSKMDLKSRFPCKRLHTLFTVKASSSALPCTWSILRISWVLKRIWRGFILVFLFSIISKVAFYFLSQASFL